ncbi:MAG TPA: dihydrodipicolinate reductase [Treponema sp.]|nr:dihydrodipicolinate reductase [Treponema sp.]
MRIGLFGFGKAGKAVAAVILESRDCTLKWVVRKSTVLDHRSAPEYLGINSEDPGLVYSKNEFNEIENGKNLEVDAIVDFSGTASIYEYGDYAVRHNCMVVTAISNYGEKEKTYLKELGQSIRILWSPNITIGINFLLIAAEVLKKIAPEADIVILEEHFKTKSEVSGTAKVLARHLDLDENNIKSIRAGGIVGKHEILFGFPYQVVRLIHESISREAFGNGAIFALRNIMDKPDGLYTMEDIIKPYFSI